MPRKPTIAECADPTQEFSINIPCLLAERIETYARERGTDFTGVLIEALDVFLRESKDR